MTCQIHLPSLLSWSKLNQQQDVDTCPNYQVLLPRDPQLSEFISESSPLGTLLVLLGLPSILKIFPIRNHMSPLRRPYHSELFHSPKSPTLIQKLQTAVRRLVVDRLIGLGLLSMCFIVLCLPEYHQRVMVPEDRPKNGPVHILMDLELVV